MEGDISLRDDPRVRDHAIWNRMKLMVADEAIDRAWGCSLYRLHRNELITTEQREAGDRYYKIIEDFRQTQQIDPDTLSPKGREYHAARIEKAKKRRDEVRDILGLGRGLLDSLIMDDEYPATERRKVFVRAMLQSLANYFYTGRKGVRKTA